MQRHQAYCFALKTRPEHERALRRFVGACRYVYNRGLALQQARYAAGEKHLSYAALCAELTRWKAETETTWLQDAHSQTLQQAVKDLGRAYTNFFEGRAGFPRFHKKGQSDSCRFPQGVKLDQPNSRLFLPKLGWIRYRNSRAVDGQSNP